MLIFIYYMSTHVLDYFHWSIDSKRINNGLESKSLIYLMDIRIDNDLFHKLKMIQIEQFKEKYPDIRFKYKQYPFFRLISLNFNVLFSLTLFFFFDIFKS